MSDDWNKQKLASFMSACGLVCRILFFWLTAKRLKDLNFPGWSVKLVSIPLFAVIALPVLCFLSGPRYANDYGDAPEASGFLKVCFALVLFAVTTLVTCKALLIAEQL